MHVANLDFHALTPNKLVVVNSTVCATNTTGLTPWGTAVLGRGFGPPSIKVRTKHCIWKTYATFVVFTGLHVGILDVVLKISFCFFHKLPRKLFLYAFCSRYY